MDENNFEKTIRQGWNRSIKAYLMTDDDEEFNSLLTEEPDLLGLRQRVIFWDTFQEKDAF